MTSVIRWTGNGEQRHGQRQPSPDSPGHERKRKTVDILEQKGFIVVFFSTLSRLGRPFGDDLLCSALAQHTLIGMGVANIARLPAKGNP